MATVKVRHMILIAIGTTHSSLMPPKNGKIKRCLARVRLENTKLCTPSSNINPLLPIAHKSARIDKISILKLEGIIKNISYERRDYESVDEKKPI